VEEAERELLEGLIEAVTLAGSAEQVRRKVRELRQFTERQKMALITLPGHAPDRRKGKEEKRSLDAMLLAVPR